jgi:polyisoprenyl-teichoic acid--peptidoglycan teichoic acid transferase
MSDNFNNNDNTVPNQEVTGLDYDASSQPTIASDPHVPPAYSTSAYTQEARSAPPPPPPSRNTGIRERSKKRRVQGRNKGSEWAWVIIAAAMMGVFAIVIVSILLILRLPQNEVDVIPTADVVAELPTPIDARTEFVTDGSEVNGDVLSLPDGSSIELRPWDGQSRFTMILAGLDRRPGETGLGFRTDTMMLVSIDPVTGAIGILSIPRDLYVQVPGYTELQRINTPMVFGESRQPGYGPTLLQQTVQLNLGIRVHDYVAVDFQAFIDIVDLIGGIDITIDYTINDAQYPNMSYGYDPFYLPAGTHHLDGYDALRFARTRHGSSDIQRAERQQQAIFAIRNRILNLDMIPQLLVQAPAIWNTMSDNVYTGLSLEQVIQLGLYSKDIDLGNIKTGVIDFSYLQSYTTESGASVLIPNRARLGSLMTEVFGANYSQ